MTKIIFSSFTNCKPVIIENLPKEDAIRIAQALSASVVCNEVIVLEQGQVENEPALFEYKYEAPF